MKKKYDVIGMTCSACSAHVDKAVRGLDGVDDVNVNLLQNSMTVEFNENKINENQIFEAVDKAGYKAQNIGEKQVSNVQEDENEHKRKNLILSFIFLIPLFYISMGHMMNWPLPSILLGHENMMIFVLVQLCLVVPIMFINRGYRSPLVAGPHALSAGSGHGRPGARRAIPGIFRPDHREPCRV